MVSFISIVFFFLSWVDSLGSHHIMWNSSWPNLGENFQAFPTFPTVLPFKGEPFLPCHIFDIDSVRLTETHLMSTLCMSIKARRPM